MIVKCNSVNKKCNKTLCPHMDDHEAEFGLHCFCGPESCDFSPIGKVKCVKVKKIIKKKEKMETLKEKKQRMIIPKTGEVYQIRTGGIVKIFTVRKTYSFVRFVDLRKDKHAESIGFLIFCGNELTIDHKDLVKKINKKYTKDVEGLSV